MEAGIRKRLEKVSKFMRLTEKDVKILLSYKKVSHAVLDVNGKKYDAWRIIHNNALGPGKGGVRFHPDVSEDEIKLLSFWMSLKTSLMGLPFGGAKGGIKVNPKELNKNEIEKLSRAYIRAFHDVIGVGKDIPAPDVYTNSQIMAWMLDEYEKIKGWREPGMITGKPVELGGIAIREDATSQGGYVVLKEFLKNEQNKRLNKDIQASEKQSSKDLDINNAEQGKKAEDESSESASVNKNNFKIAIQGFGNAGMNIAKILFKDGFNVVAVSDSKGGIINHDGLNIEEVVDAKKRLGSVQDYKKEGVEKISNRDLLELDADLLILAALENQITSAEKIKARYILELANGPISDDADEKLFERGVVIIPDILANAGGVVASYFEWWQNKSGRVLDEKELRIKFNGIMINSFNKVWRLYKKNKGRLSIRDAAYVIAVKRILGKFCRRRLSFSIDN